MTIQSSYLSKRTLQGTDRCSCCNRVLHSQNFKQCNTQDVAYCYTRCCCGAEQFKVFRPGQNR